MTDWTSDELDRIANADELRVAPRQPDGTARPPTTIWVVRQDDGLYVRSYRGADGAWYRAASSSHQGHIESGGVDKDVVFTDETDPAVNERIDAAYRSKYGGYDARFVDPMVSDGARATTLRLSPR